MNKENYKKVGSVMVECRQGDITDQPDMEAIVNAANAQLMPGGGVAGAIHARAGPGLARECRPLAPIKPGDAVITGAHDLPNKHVIHCLGPVYGVDKPEAKLLSGCYLNALKLCEANAVHSVAFPAISTGIFGYPLEEAANVSLGAVRDFKLYCNLDCVRFVLWSDNDWQLFCQVMEKMFT